MQMKEVSQVRPISWNTLRPFFEQIQEKQSYTRFYASLQYAQLQNYEYALLCNNSSFAASDAD